MTALRRAGGVAAWLLAAALPAQAELWGFVDGRGVAHFAPRPLDSRYQLVLGERGPALAVPGKTDAAGRLLVWLDIAPEVKAVQPWLREAARTQGVDAELLKAIIAVESGYDARAQSPRGALGLMQLMPGSADRYATDDERRQPAAVRLLDARTNILTGARMLADLLRRHPRVDHALAAWNAGEGSVRRHGGLPPIAETQAHVQQVLELYWALLQRSLGPRAHSIALRP
ncbi:MAG: lytic transglycosylase domain-containing protein [Rubrivivax sp.]